MSFNGVRTHEIDIEDLLASYGNVSELRIVFGNKDKDSPYLVLCLNANTAKQTLLHYETVTVTPTGRVNMPKASLLETGDCLTVIEENHRAIEENAR